MGLFFQTLKLIRTVNCLLAMVGVGVGAYLTGGPPSFYAALMTSISAFLVCAAGNVVNDLVDVGIDRIIHPARPLVMGTVTRRYASILSIVATTLGIGIGLTVSAAVTGIVVGAACLLAAYNFGLKRIVVVGNVSVAALSALTFVAGGVAVDPRAAFSLPGPLVPAAFAFLFHMVREIVKDVQDMEGDRTAGIRTLPQVIGVSRALIAALVLFLLLSIITLIPSVFGWYGGYYEIVAVYLMDIPLVALLVLIWRNPTPTLLRVGSTALKFGMGLGIVALLLA
ncbi:MAG: geranylgeranylglycerol-phosphate geranylgeranyltransferase [Candidatus Zixiibacteriota bacterium]